MHSDDIVIQHDWFHLNARNVDGWRLQLQAGNSKLLSDHLGGFQATSPSLYPFFILLYSCALSFASTLKACTRLSALLQRIFGFTAFISSGVLPSGTEIEEIPVISLIALFSSERTVA